MKALILCNDFPPLNSIGAQRPYSWFNYFKANGIEPTVITKYWNEAENASKEDFVHETELSNSIVEELPEGRVIKVRQKLIKPDQMILKHGLDRKVLQRKVQTLRHKLRSWKNSKYDKHLPIYEAARELLQKEQFDVVIATGEPFILFKYGYLLKKEFGVKFVADYRDGWYLNHVVKLSTSFLVQRMRSYELKFERKYMQAADYISTVDPFLAKQLKELHNRPVLVCYNGFWDFFEGEKKESEKLILSHTGTLTPGQRAEFLLDAVAQLHAEGKITESDLEIRFIGLEYFADQTARVKNHASSIKGYIKTTLRVPRDEAMQLNFESDFLLSFSEKDYKAIFAKNYDYLSTKRPMLLIPDDESILADFIHNLNAGESFKTVEALKDFLLQAIDKKRNGTLGAFVQINEAAAIEYTRARQTALFAEQLKKSI